MAVGEGRIAGLVPPPTLVTPSVGVRPGGGVPLPVVPLLVLPRTGPLRYGLARVDSAGVVSNRDTIIALGWQAGDRLHLVVVAGSVVVHRHPGGAFVKATKPYVLLPAGVRHRCGVRSGDQVLVVADPAQDVLVVHPLAALDSMITAYHATLADGGASA